MSKEYVILLITEGIESYTEVNFFNNFFNHFTSKNVLISVGFAKASKDKTHNFNIQKFKREVLSKIENLDKSNNIFIFSFSDLEKRVEKSKTAMLSTANKLKNEIVKLDLKTNIFINDHIFFKGSSFEDVLDFKFVNKKKSYLKGFNDFCIQKNLFTKKKLDKGKLKDYFKNNPLEPIINKILDIM